MIVGLVHGGSSTERAVSTKNAGYIREALDRRGYDTRMIEYDGELMESLRRERVDLVFLCVQGKGHGDGTLQALLDYMGVPYTGSGMTAAALINDKILCKELFAFHGHQTPEWQVLKRAEFLSGGYDREALKYPFVAKAPTQGGSFGIRLIRCEEELPLMADPFRYDETILLEDYAPGCFVTVGLWPGPEGIRALPCVEGLDLRSAPEDGLTLFLGDYTVRRPELPQDITERLRREALEIFRECGARDYARVDFIVSPDRSRLDVLEINAVPGLKPQSLYPRAAELAGMDYDDLIEGILLSAVRRTKLCSET